MSKIMKLQSQVKRWGNSLAIRVPSALAQELGLIDNTIIEIDSNGHSATLKPQRPQRIKLDELIAEISTRNLHTEVDLGGPVGREVW